MKLTLKNTQVTGLSETQGYLISPKNPVKIKAVPNSKVELFIDGVKQTGTELVNGKPAQLKKVGNNLVLSVDGEPLVEIDDFYDSQGVSLDGAGWQFTNADALGIQEGSVVPLAQEITPQALPLLAVAGAGTGVGALAVLGAVGLVAAAAGGDGISARDAALNKIENYNNDNGTDTPVPTVQDYIDAGVTGVSEDNLAALNAQVLKQNTGGANTAEEIQLLTVAANAAIAKIEAYNNGNGTTPPALTLADYADAGITGVTADNLAAINAKILALPTGGADTAPEIQDVANATIATIAKIEAYNNGNGITPAALTVADYVAADITGVSADNLAAVNAQVLKQATGGADSPSEVQALVTLANAAIAKIESYNNGNGTTPPALTLADYVDAGITGVTADNLAAINAKILALPTGGANTAPEIQDVVAALNTALTKIEAYNNGNGTTPPALTLTDYADAGITGVTADNLAAVNAQVLRQALGGADTPVDVQLLVTAANSAIQKIENYNNGNGTTPAALTVADYEAAGITGVTADNLGAVNAQVLAQIPGGANTDPKVQLLVVAGNAAIAKIENYNNGNGTTPAALTIADYVAAGVTGVTADNLTAVNAQVLAQIPGGANTDPKVQLLVVAGNAAIAKIENYNNGNGTTPAALTVADYVAAGVTGVTGDNLAAVNVQVLNQAPGGADSAPEIQTLVAGVTTAVAALSAFAQNNANGINNPTGTVPDLASFANAGLTGVTAANLSAIDDALASAVVDGSKTDTAAKIQTLINDYNAILASADGPTGTPTTTPITTAQYSDIGITNAPTGSSLNLLGSVIDVKVTTAVDSVSEVQALADAAKAVIGGAGTGTPPTKAQLDLLGVANVTADNLAAVQAAIKATDDTGTAVDTLTKLQAVVDQARSNYDAALIAIKTAAEGDTANSTTPSLDTYLTAGVTGVTVGNLAAINSALDSALVNGSKADTTAKVQAIVDSYKAILAAADGPSGADAAPLTGEQFAAVGVTGVATGSPTPGTALALLDSVVDASPQTAVNTQSLVQAMATGANHVMAAAGGSSTDAAALTLADLSALGINTNGHTIAEIRTALQALTSDASTDTLGELQDVISNIPDTQPSFSTNLGNATNLDVTSNLVLSLSSAVNVGSGLIRIKDLGGSNAGTGFHNDTTNNSVDIDVSTAVANDLITFDATKTKIIINPKYDLDLSSNYSISIDAGAFVDQSTGALSQSLAAVNFSTVTPGTHSTNGTLASDGRASQIMDANGALQTSKSWIDLESYNTNNTNGITQIGDLSLGSYALVMKNYATAPGGVYPNPEDGGSVGIQLHDVSIGVSNFAANDQLYFDSQANNPAVQMFAPEFLSAIQNAGIFTGGVAGQNLLNFDYDPNATHLGSSNQIALGFEGSTKIFQYIYAYPGFTDIATTLGIPAPVVMG